MDDLQQVVGQIVEQIMVKFAKVRRVFSVLALSIAAVTAAACGMAPAPDKVARVGVNPKPNPYACYFADGSTADKVVEGQTLHWCGPVPRAVQ